MAEKGIVVQLDKNKATVEIERSEACAKCKACIGFGENKMRVEVENKLDAQLGETVGVELEPHSLILAAAVMYGAPLAITVGALWIGYKISGNELIAFGTGILGFFLSFGLIKSQEFRFSRNKRFKPVMAANKVERPVNK